jgi:hypothetical protein
MSHRSLFDTIYKSRYTSTDKRIKFEFISAFMETAVAVDVNNVYEWVLSHNGTFGWDEHKEWIPKRTPFPEMWLEWECLHEDGSFNTHSKMGILTTEIPSETSLLKMQGKLPHDKEEEIDFRLQVNVFSVLPPNYPCLVGMAEWNPDDGDFKLYDYEHPVVGEEGEKMKISEMMIAFNVLVPTLMFFNCKNVQVVKKEVSIKQDKAMARKNIIDPEFHFIEIHNKAVKNVYEGGVAKRRTLTHASMVRGHFKTYTEENKLFGQKTGTWFWSSHVRGDFGTPTINDYRVHGPKHKGECQ